MAGENLEDFGTDVEQTHLIPFKVFYYLVKQLKIRV